MFSGDSPISHIYSHFRQQTDTKDTKPAKRCSGLEKFTPDRSELRAMRYFNEKPTIHPSDWGASVVQPFGSCPTGSSAATLFETVIVFASLKLGKTEDSVLNLLG